MGFVYIAIWQDSQTTTDRSQLTTHCSCYQSTGNGRLNQNMSLPEGREKLMCRNISAMSHLYKYASLKMIKSKAKYVGLD